MKVEKCETQNSSEMKTCQSAKWTQTWLVYRKDLSEVIKALPLLERCFHNNVTTRWAVVTPMGVAGKAHSAP